MTPSLSCVCFQAGCRFRSTTAPESALFKFQLDTPDMPAISRMKIGHPQFQIVQVLTLQATPVALAAKRYLITTGSLPAQLLNPTDHQPILGSVVPRISHNCVATATPDQPHS